MTDNINEQWRRYRHMAGILHEVHNETERQIEKWGLQDHPLAQLQTSAEYAKAAELAKQAFSFVQTVGGNPGWDLILFEEIYEALGEVDLDKARAEWIQVAAVAVSAIENIDRAVRDMSVPGEMPKAGAA